MKKIRNFSIIAHIDHGKSTFSDRIIQLCGGLSDREMISQVLDTMEIERERGITIKSQSVTLQYKSYNNEIYQFNLIDTPGHVDFSYEVSRSLLACEGSLLLIDASQGIEAQTLSNCYKAISMGIKVIPVINKIDLTTENIKKIKQDIKEILKINTDNIINCSAKTGEGITDVLEQIIKYIPPPKNYSNYPLQALIIDSWFDNYFGVVSLVRVKQGILRKGEKVKIISTGKLYKIQNLGIFTPKRIDLTQLNCGEVGWITCAIKDINGAPILDTITTLNNPADKISVKCKKYTPQIYAGFFPEQTEDYDRFNCALKKLSLNDAALFYEKENSVVLGFGFRCGFLGLLHMEIIKERLKKEYNLNIITTSPTVIYEIITIDKKKLYIDNPSKISSLNKILELREPIAKCHILVPQNFLGNIIKLCASKRGIQNNIIYHGRQVELIYEIPISEIIINFFDKLKSNSKGYASLDYHFKYFRKSDLVCIDIIINNNKIDTLSIICHKTKSLNYSYKLVNKLKEVIPRQQFDIIVQAAIGKRIIARSTIKQLRRNVIAKCYGGDISRKKKLLSKQKEGKKRMKKIGKVYLPQKAFLTALNIDK